MLTWVHPNQLCHSHLETRVHRPDLVFMPAQLFLLSVFGLLSLAGAGVVGLLSTFGVEAAGVEAAGVEAAGVEVAGVEVLELSFLAPSL